MIDLGGTFRAVTPEETLARIEPMLFDTFGITRVANITHLDNVNIPTYVAVRPFSRLLTTAQGKGITPALAKISAIMESIEGWHAERLPPPDLIGSYHNLSVHFPLMTLDNAFFSGFLRYSPDALMHTELPWLKGTELCSGKEIYFPASLIDMDVTQNQIIQSYIPGSTNGLASGNTFEEAVCHAIYEVIERDCEAKHSDARLVDLTTITAPHIKDLLACIDKNTMHLSALDITNHLGVPTFSARLTDKTGLHAIGCYGGAGTHISSVIALSRAITEAIQTRLTFISGTRDNLYPGDYLALQSVASHMLEKEESKSTKLYPFVETDVPGNLNDCLRQLLRRLNEKGFKQVIVYDHTRPDIGIPVVHVIIPGLLFKRAKHKTTGYMHCIP